MSAICQNFVQNAWKKELCSNCFKSKDEHAEKLPPKAISMKPEKIVASIIKRHTKIANAKRTVSFTAEISKVIGYGGEYWSDNDEDFISEDCSEDNDYEADGEEEKEMQRITKNNTDFNTVNANLLNESTPENRKNFASLKLGTPQVDSAGKKQTLLVSVTPFGEDNSTPNRKYIKPTPPVSFSDNSKETVKKHITIDKENGSEKSLLEEISETLEKGSNRISIMNCKSTENSDEKNSESSENDIKSNVMVNKNVEIVDRDAKVKMSSIPDRKVMLTRAPVIKRSAVKLELYSAKNYKFRNSRENLSGTVEATNTILKADDASKNLSATESKLIIEKDKIEKHSDSEESNKADSVTDTDNYEDVSNSDTNNSLTESLKDVTFDEKSPSKGPGSRELAGEPDGHADPDCNNDLPALPSTPPPFESRSSFLHGPGSEKPKSATVLIRKPAVATNNHVGSLERQNILTTFSSEPPKIPVDTPVLPPENPVMSKTVTEHHKEIYDCQKSQLSKQDSAGSDYGKSTNKRRAPMPPPSEESTAYYKKPIAPLPDNHESSSKDSPSLYNDMTNGDSDAIEPKLTRYVSPPEVAPRRTISLSSDNLTSSKFDDKKKDKAKQRFSLKKFLRMNSSSKELNKDIIDAPRLEPQRQNANGKQRLVIVHPSELNGEKIEVVAKPVIPPEVADYSPLNIIQNGIYNSTSSLHRSSHSVYENRSFKPAPPPRNLELYGPSSKPALPQPPKALEASNKQKTARPPSPKPQDSVYANIGEVRSAITPHKPQRTASMREREAALAAAQKQKSNGHVYEPINMNRAKKDANENVYDYINGVRSSSPEYDLSSSPNKNSPGEFRKALGQGKSCSNLDVSGEGYNKPNGNIPRSSSLTYCGSETESEIYSPYGFYASEGEIFDDEKEWPAVVSGNKTHKLRSRKGRSIVHKNLEDNYGAVVVANHEALAQVLENITHVPTVLPALRGLKTNSSLRWSDFTIKQSENPLILGPRIFQQALWGAQHVTLVVHVGTIPSSSLSLGNFTFVPITEFVDLIPTQDIPSLVGKNTDNIQATIAVLPWMQVHSVKTYSDFLRSKGHLSEDSKKEAILVVLQLINALKMLQAQGIEELPESLTTFVLSREVDKDGYFRLCVLQGLGEDPSRSQQASLISLCQCASIAISHLLPEFKLTSLLRSLLNTERAISLTQVKSVLEFSLWGPSDVSLGSNIRERELALQRWLDLQRATVLHGLVCAKIKLTVYEECHLLFLVRCNSKMICDASLLVESAHVQNNYSRV